MTEAILTTEETKTPLAEFLSRSGPGSERPELVSYHGVLTPLHLDAAERKTDALLFGAAVHDLGWLRRIAVRGEDRFRWLSGMVTNAVETLGTGSEFESGAYNLVLNAQGRIQGDCYVWRKGDALEIEVTAEQADALLAHFDKFIIMDDVELVPLEGVSALGLAGPLASSILKQLGVPVLQEPLTGLNADVTVACVSAPIRVTRGFGPVVERNSIWIANESAGPLWQALVEASAIPVDAAAIELLRVVEGMPAYGVDIQSRDLAQETSQDRALSFSKGCYLGQEIVERVRSRGQVHRHLRSLELFPEPGISAEAQIAGIELKVSGAGPEGKTAATLSSIAAIEVQGERRIFAIGMVRAEAEVGSRDLIYEGGTARVLSAPPKFTKG